MSTPDGSGSKEEENDLLAGVDASELAALIETARHGNRRGVTLTNIHTGKTFCRIGQKKQKKTPPGGYSKTTTEHVGSGSALIRMDDSRVVVGATTPTTFMNWVQVVNFRSRKVELNLSGHGRGRDGICALAWINQPRGLLASASTDDRKIMIWDAHSGVSKKTLVSSVNALSVSNFKNEILCSGGEHGICLWDVEHSYRECGSITGTGRVSDLVCGSEWLTGTVASASTRNHNIQLYSLQTLEPTLSFRQANPVAALCCDPAERFSFLAGDVRGEIRTWDVRKPDVSLTIVRMGNVHSVSHIAALPKGFWGACVSPGNTTFWSSGGRNPKVVHADRSYSAICSLVTDENAVSSTIPQSDLAELAQVLLSSESLTIRLRDLDENSIFTSRTFVESIDASFPLRLVESGLFQGDSTTTESFIHVLMGSVPEPHALWNFYRLFRALKMLSHAYLICKAVLAINDLPRLVGLAHQIKETFVIQENAVDPDALLRGGSPSREKVRPDTSVLNPFATAVLEALSKKMEALRENFALLHSLSHSIQSLILSGASFSLTEHEDFAELKPEFPSSFSSLFSKSQAKLFESRKFSDVLLTTEDGGEERVHVGILVLCNKMFFQMLKFGGAELESLKSNRTIAIDSFSHADLSALLEWIYTGCLSESASQNAGILLQLLIHSEMYNEKKLMRSVKSALRVLFGGDSADVVGELWATSELIVALPDALREWLVGILPPFDGKSYFRLLSLFAQIKKGIDAAEEEEDSSGSSSPEDDVD